MVDKGKKSSMETFMPSDKADYYFRITSITVNEKNAYELKGKFLDDMHNNAFNGTNGKDTVEHIEYYLKIIDPIKLPNVDHDKLRVVVFPISLAGGARRWFDKTKESITCGDEIEVSDDESSDLEEYRSDKEETAKFFKIETDVFEYETPLCLAFNEFNYILKVDPDLQKILWGLKPMKITKTIGSRNGTKIYHGVMRNHELKLEFGQNQNHSNIHASLSTKKLSVRHGQSVYKALEDNELKDEALRNKAIMEGLISDDESCNDCWKRWKSHEIYYHNYDKGDMKMKLMKKDMSYVVSKLARTLEAKNINEYWWIIYKSGKS
ncbi:hypothetical protein Tco_1570657 [Tanacetum coccineum]